jgi:hypothetical protein
MRQKPHSEFNQGSAFYGLDQQAVTAGMLPAYATPRDNIIVAYQMVSAVEFAHPARVPSGALLAARPVGQLRPDEFLIVRFDAALGFTPFMGLEFTGAQFLLVEAGLSGSVV